MSLQSESIHGVAARFGKRAATGYQSKSAQSLAQDLLLDVLLDLCARAPVQRDSLRQLPIAVCFLSQIALLALSAVMNLRGSHLCFVALTTKLVKGPFRTSSAFELAFAHFGE